MTGLLGVAVYCVAVVVLVLALARFAEWSVRFWDNDPPQAPVWLVVGWHRWRFHTLTRTANGDVLCWTCTRPLVWQARQSETWAWTSDFEDGEPDPADACDGNGGSVWTYENYQFGPHLVEEPCAKCGEWHESRTDRRPGLDAEYDLELHVADAMRVANEDEQP